MLKIDPQLVQLMAQLSQLVITAAEEQKYADGFTTTMSVVDRLKKIDVGKAQPTYQVTGLKNVWREDLVDEQRMFSQQQALQNAPDQWQGYVKVPQILDQS